MQYLAEQLPNLIIYISLGFVFIRTYKYVRIIERLTDRQDIIIEYLTFGFVICKIFNAIPWTINVYIDLLGMVFSTFLVAYFLATFINSAAFDSLCDHLNIKQTPNDDIWRDIEDRNCGVYIKVVDMQNDIMIDGLLVLYEQHKKTPYIQLSAYRETKGSDIIYDYSKEPQQTILIDTAKFDRVIITYDEDSPKVKAWK